MRGAIWCIWLVGLGLPLALLGLTAGWDKMTAAGAGMMAAAVVGWPVLLLAGALHDATGGGFADRS